MMAHEVMRLRLYKSRGWLSLWDGLGGYEEAPRRQPDASESLLHTFHGGIEPRGEFGLLFYPRWHSICSCSTPSYVAVTPPVTHSSFKQKFGHHRCIVWISLVARSFCTWGNIALSGNFRGFKQQSLSWCVIWTWVKRTFVISCGGVLYSKCLRLIKYFFNMSPQPQLIETFQGFFSSYLGIYVLTVKFINIHTPLKMMTLFLQT